MDAMTTPNFDCAGFVQKITGLTPRELYIFVNGLNGIIPSAFPDVQFSAAKLAVEFDAMGEQSHLDREEVGLDLSRLADDNAETPLNYHDIAEKLRAMRDD